MAGTSSIGRRGLRGRGAVFTSKVLPGLTAVFMALCCVAVAVDTFRAESLNRVYSAAAACPPERPGTTVCRSVEPAVVEGQPAVSKGKVRDTWVKLRATDRSAGGDAASTVYTSSIDGDVAGGLTDGEHVTMTLWRSHITEIATPTQHWLTKDNPRWQAGNDAALAVFALCVAGLASRYLGWRLFGRAVRRGHFVLADATVLVLVLIAVVLDATHLVVVGSIIVLVDVGLLAAFCTVYPRLPWVRCDAVYNPRGTGRLLIDKEKALEDKLFGTF
jgi:hypothetical protein